MKVGGYGCIRDVLLPIDVFKTFKGPAIEAINSAVHVFCEWPDHTVMAV